jgi:hypothetical protein
MKQFTIIEGAAAAIFMFTVIIFAIIDISYGHTVMWSTNLLIGIIAGLSFYVSIMHRKTK